MGLRSKEVVKPHSKTLQIIISAAWQPVETLGIIIKFSDSQPKTNSKIKRRTSMNSLHVETTTPTQLSTSEANNYLLS